MKFLCMILLLTSARCFAQYPFEKYPAIKSQKVLFHWISPKKDMLAVAKAHYKSYRIELLQERLKDSGNILVYFNSKLIKKINVRFDLTQLGMDEPLYVEDINGDGLTDFKIAFENDGSGLAGSLNGKVYLFNCGNNRFKSIFFMDFYGKSKKEYDFNHDGNYEILGQSYLSYKNHAYWLFDLYDYKNGRLANVSKQCGYPIAVPYLYNETFKPTNKISKKDLRRLSLKVPEFYSSN